MKLIVGLGNPGEKYEYTRHNLGFMALEKFLKDNTPSSKTKWSINKKWQALTAEITSIDKTGKEQKILLLKPQTFMNLSGEAVRAVVSFYKIDPHDIWVVHDELDLPLGSLKIRIGGSSAGHKGLQSIMESLTTEQFWRFRLGIGISRPLTESEDGKHKPLGATKIRDAEEFVVGEFSSKETGEVKKMLKNTVLAMECALEKDMKSAQNKFNSK